MGNWKDTRIENAEENRKMRQLTKCYKRVSICSRDAKQVKQGLKLTLGDQTQLQAV